MDKVVADTDALVRRHAPAPLSAEQALIADALLKRWAADAGISDIPDWNFGP